MSNEKSTSSTSGGVSVDGDVTAESLTGRDSTTIAPETTIAPKITINNSQSLVVSFRSSFRSSKPLLPDEAHSTKST